MFHHRLNQYTASLPGEFMMIEEERKIQLQKLSGYVESCLKETRSSQLLFVCTQNSRRSHLSQIFATVAAHGYGIKSFLAYSAGSEKTAVHPNTVAALQRGGIQIKKITEGKNPVYEATFGTSFSAVQLFSKEITDPSLPQKKFGAVMVCVADAEECPFIPDADIRIGLAYADPKKGDGLPDETKIYDASCRQIAREMFYVFSLLRSAVA